MRALAAQPPRDGPAELVGPRPRRPRRAGGAGRARRAAGPPRRRAARSAPRAGSSHSSRGSGTPCATQARAHSASRRSSDDLDEPGQHVLVADHLQRRRHRPAGERRSRSRAGRRGRPGPARRWAAGRRPSRAAQAVADRRRRRAGRGASTSRCRARVPRTRTRGRSRPAIRSARALPGSRSSTRAAASRTVFGAVVEGALEERLVGGGEAVAQGQHGLGRAPWRRRCPTRPRAGRAPPPGRTTSCRERRRSPRPSPSSATAPSSRPPGRRPVRSLVVQRRGPGRVEPDEPRAALAERATQRTGDGRRAPAAKSSSAGSDGARHPLPGRLGQPQPLHDELVAGRLGDRRLGEQEVQQLGRGVAARVAASPQAPVVRSARRWPAGAAPPRVTASASAAPASSRCSAA